MSKKTRNVLIILAALLVVVLIAVISGRHGSKLAVVHVVKIGYSRFVAKLPESGVIQHPGTATIPTLVGGNVAAIYAQAGQAVVAGQLLATVDAPTLASTAAGSQADYGSAIANIATARSNEQNSKVQYQAQVDTAKSALDLAQRVYLADVNLYKNKAIARQTLDTDKAKRDQAQVQFDQANAQLRLGAVSGYGQNSVQAAQADAQKAQIVNAENQQQLGFTRIVAPFSGVIQTIATNPNDPLRNVQSGDALTAGQALFTIAQGNGFIVKAEVDEQDIINVRLGQACNITGEDFPGHNIAGHVSYIAPVATKSTDASNTSKEVLTTISMDATPSYLKDGMSANIDIYTTSIAHAIAIPNTAIVQKSGKPNVWVVRNGKLHEVPIKRGISNDTSTIVTSGVTIGDSVVAAPDATLVEGAAAKPMPVVSPSPGALAT